MDHSWSTIPHITASREIDASPLLEARRQLRDANNGDHGDPGAAPITPLALVVMAVARALGRYPMMNGSLDLEAETITVPDRVNIGIAVATEHGLLVPVIADADRLGLGAIATEIHRLSTSARDRTIRPEDLSGGTHTITNYGSAGGHLAAPIIRPGEAAITGLGSIEDRPIVIDGEVVARPTLPVVVCSDHRLIDGDVMSAFHLDVCRTLSAPIGLLL
jgi:pyruvate dehydrogenase E2 component (dihydrolipoamide acetyltransferase)